MEEFVKDKFRIDNGSRNDCSLYCYVNIDKHILIRVTEYCSDTGTDFFGESETEYNDAGIELTKDMAIRLRDELDRLIKSNYPLVISSVCTCTKFRETPMINGKHICSICNKPIVQTDL